MKKILALILVLALLATSAVQYRYRILIPLATSGETIPLNPNALPVTHAEPFGDGNVFATLKLDDATYAIAEPYSWARNFNYLFIGSERALLLDAGVGHYDIREVVASLTNLPVTFMPSHFHYDHTGQANFESIALLDLPHIREQANGNKITLSWGDHLGVAEGIAAPTWTIDEWVKPGTSIDLGNRQLTLLYTPGHTDNSVSIYDKERAKLYSGDYISRNSMSAYYPGGSLGDYLQSAGIILDQTSANTVLHSAHGQDDPGLPTLGHEDVATLQKQLERIKSGELKSSGIYPVVYQITATQVISAEPRWLQNWQPTYPMETPN